MRYEVPDVFDLTVPETDGLPLILDSPHSGQVYPPGFEPLVSKRDLRRVEDSFVDQLFDQAPRFGATLLNAHFPRTFIDANRASSDLDPAMLDGPWMGPMRPTEKSRLGHGLIWKTYPPDRAMYRSKLSVAEVEQRIEGYWRPYHEALENELMRQHSQHGQVWHLNCHSMPSTSSPYIPGRAGTRADFVLGDRDGTTCERAFILFARETLEEMGYNVRLNDPYRGAELVRAYSAPNLGRHSLQIEINRALYLDEFAIEKGRGFDALKDSLTQLLKTLSGYVSDRLDAATAAAAE